MYHSQTVTTRRGPLSKVWLAAHFDKKLSKSQIFTTDITASVHSLLQNENHLNLKVSGQLMLGIVKIYAKKLKYLMNDCTESMWKMKLALRPGQVDIEILTNNSHFIDDTRHFGNINTDFDFPILENIAFDSQYLLSTGCLEPNSNDNNEDSYNSSFISGHTSLNRNSISFADNNFIDDKDFIPNFNDPFSPLPNRRYSEIEFARNVNNERASLLSTSNVNISTDTPIQQNNLDDIMISSIKEKDNDAVTFSTFPEEDLFTANEFNDYYPQEFDSPQREIKEENADNDEDERVDNQEMELTEQDENPRKRPKINIPEVEVEISEKINTSKKSQPLKMRRVIVNENVELSDSEYKKHMRNSKILLRRSINDSLSFQKNERLYENQFNNQKSLNSLLNNDFKTLFSYSFNQQLYSSELGFFSCSVLGPNSIFPLPKKSNNDSVDEFETIRGAINSRINDNESNRLSILDIKENINVTEDKEANQFNEIDESDRFDINYYDNNIDLDHPVSPGSPIYHDELNMAISSRLDDIFSSNQEEMSDEAQSIKAKSLETHNSKKTEATLKLINEEFEKLPTESKKITFDSFCQTKDRRVAVQCFFEILQLKSNNSIQINQKFNQDIFIMPVK